MMSRSGKASHSALLLEGYDDERVYRNYTHSTCLLFAMDGRDQVLGTLKILAFRRQSGVAGLIDADCDYLDSKTHPTNVFRTDLRDLECMLVDSPSLRKVLNEHLISSNVDVNELKSKLVLACRDLGYLRWVALRNGWSLDFKTLNFKNFVEVSTLKSERKNLAKEVLSKNVGFQATEEELVKLIHEAEHASHHGLHVCCGHDLATVLGLWIGHQKSHEVSRYKIQQQLRLAIESEHFLRSRLFTQMRGWEATNKPYRLLADSGKKAVA
jgi:hypothetical protein